MTVLDVVGGLYGEVCRFPPVEEIYGSGGRAAFALAEAGCKVRLHYYCPPALQKEARDALASPGLLHHPVDSTVQFTFTYLHPLSKPIFEPGEISGSPSISIDAERVLRFGMMEGDAVVSARTCVYDPQSLDPTPFSQNGSVASSLAIVLNHEEICRYTKENSEIDAVQRIAGGQSCSVILVKAGIQGCRIYESGQLIATVPPYHSDRVYKIGTGDIFTAAFAHAWLLDGCGVVTAADHASRCVARYAESRQPSTAKCGLDQARQPIPIDRKAVVHVIGSKSSMSGHLLMNEAHGGLQRMGVTVFSDDHLSKRLNINALHTTNDSTPRRSDVVLALLDSMDSAILLEISQAAELGLPIVVYAQGEEAGSVAILNAPSARICNDFASALYLAAWGAQL